MSYQRGRLKKVPRKAGEMWVLRYRVTQGERRVEHINLVGLVCDFPKVKDARIHFDALAEHYLRTDFGENAIRPKSINTIAAVQHYTRNYLIPR